MAPVVTFFVAVGTALGFVGTTALIIGGIVTVGTIWLASQALKMQQQGISGTLVNKEGTVVPIPIVYGKRRVGGHRTFMGSSGSDNKYLHMIFTVCEGPIEAIDEVYFNDELAASWSGNTLTYHNGYGGKLIVERYHGDQTTACASLVAANIGWTNAHIGYGVAYLYLRFTYDQDVYDSGLPEVTVTVRGRKFYNPLTQTTQWTDNPAVCIYEYMTNDFYGKNINPNLIRMDKLQEASDYFNEIVTNTDATTEKRYTLNAVLDPDNKMLDNLQQMLLACRSSLVTAEQYQLLPDQPLNTDDALEINDDNIIGNITYVQANKRSLLNEVRAKYPNATNTELNYKEDYVIVKSSDLLAMDGVKLKADLEMPHTTSTTMVERILIEEINQSRQSGSLSVVTTTQLYKATVGDVVKFTNDTLGQYQKLYRIVGQTLTADHTMELQLKEYDPMVYNDNSNNQILINNKDDTYY